MKHDFEPVHLFGNEVIEQVYYRAVCVFLPGVSIKSIIAPEPNTCNLIEFNLLCNNISDYTGPA